ncbi:CBF beta domain containing protein [Trichuris trichiura]|uniref:CBF beta domain containing protein n=1 Tax=Trichuris trichiura TaxID=36087 RepID=A0A077Z188_TRITR|nr:CBF beta domain containing protein [Trichuris trichiura]
MYANGQLAVSFDCDATSDGFFLAKEEHRHIVGGQTLNFFCSVRPRYVSIYLQIDGAATNRLANRIGTYRHDKALALHPERNGGAETLCELPPLLLAINNNSSSSSSSLPSSIRVDGQQFVQAVINLWGLVAILRAMPRVVADQKSKFETDELFVSVSRPTEIVYTGLLCGNEEERRRQFLRDCFDRHLNVVRNDHPIMENAFLPAGLNLELDISGGDDPSLAADSLNTESDPVKVFVCAHMILNGVCVRLRGWIDRITLRGTGVLEFDSIHAELERQRLDLEAGIHCTTATAATSSLLVYESSSSAGDGGGGGDGAAGPPGPSGYTTTETTVHTTPQSTTPSDETIQQLPPSTDGHNG